MRPPLPLRIPRVLPATALVIAITLSAMTAPAAAAPPVTCRPHHHVVLAPPPAGSAYASAFPNFSDTTHSQDGVTTARIDTFQALAERPIVWAYFSNHWADGRIVFPRAAVRAIWRHGQVPFVRMMPWSNQRGSGPDPVFTMLDIARGRWDRQLIRWARGARATGVPMMVDFGVEVNGDWFPWNGRWQGGPRRGPLHFRRAYRHIVQLFRAQSARNVSFAFHAAGVSIPTVNWNRIAAYYPGDAYVDWIGVSVYGSVDTAEPWATFADGLAKAYPQLTALSATKPIGIFEWGVVESPAMGDKATWITQAFATLAAEPYPRISAISWWHERWQEADGHFNDTRINSSPAALTAYRSGIAEPRYVSTPSFTCARG